VGVKELEPDRFALLDLLPELLVKEICHGVASWFHQGDSAADGNAAGQGVADRERHGKVDGGKGKRFGHIIAPVIQVFDAMEQ